LLLQAKCWSTVFQPVRLNELGSALFCKDGSVVGCALINASEAKIEIEAKILFRLKAKKGMILLVHIEVKQQKYEAKTKINQCTGVYMYVCIG
jgi:hypothetical protein